MSYPSYRDDAVVPCSVLVRKVADLERSVAEALDFLEYDFKDKRVWVKPNMLSPHPPEHSVTTDPEIIRQVVRGLKARGTSAVWVADNPGGGLQRDVAAYMTPTGIVEASEGSFRSISETPVALPLTSRFVKEIHVSRILTEADVILNLPVFKTHALTILTGCIKNLFGIIPGKQKSHLHTVVRSGDEFGELLVDIFQAVPIPVLNIMDALRGMDGQNGPSGGRVRKIGRLITAANPVALDAVMAAMTGADPKRIPTTRIAGERGLGPTALDGIKVVGDFERIPGFRLPSARLAGSLTGIAAAVAYPFMRRWPIANRRLCTKCGQCADNCPVCAIAISEFPEIDRRKCIMCYCCAELCPEKAMAVPGPSRGVIQHLFGR